MNLSFKQFSVYVALFAIGSGLGLWGSRNWKLSPQSQQSLPVAVVDVPPKLPTPLPIQNTSFPGLTDPNFIAEAVERVGPAVVRIDATRTVAVEIPDGLGNPLLRPFFGESLPSERTERGTGSGFILSADGRILTNAHVVEGAPTVDVKFKDGRVLEGKVVGTDSLTDVAVVKVEATDLPITPLASSTDLVPGQWAIAIGNPLGLDNTVTVGIISAVDRSSSQVGMGDRHRVRFIQTDAAINPGNSGGPLLNDRGEAIGVNTAIRANARGLGFAIPIETAQRVAEQIFTRGRAQHPFLGIQMVAYHRAIADSIELENPPEDGEVVVVEVLEDSPAAKAQMRSGDIIRAIDGIPIEGPADVQDRVAQSDVGAILKV
ncbi:MAG: trypsin-like peptidase domain-containing protein, partial [Cyanobacteriota bacterium]|nr:trypsin-like peptidase domain-containing protein [Cyanobacteriota bacterium]